MQPENLIARLEPFVLGDPAVEPSNLGRPCVTALKAADRLDAQAKPLGNALLHFTGRNRCHDFAVSSVSLIHFPLKPSNDSHSFVGSFCLHLEIGPNHQQQSSNVMGIGDFIAEKALMAFAGAPPVFNDTADAKPIMDGVQCRLECIGYPYPQTPSAFVDFDASLAVHETCEVAGEDFNGPCVHALNIAKYRRLDNSNSMAVPVLRWILSRIESQSHPSLLRATQK